MQLQKVPTLQATVDQFKPIPKQFIFYIQNKTANQSPNDMGYHYTKKHTQNSYTKCQQNMTKMSAENYKQVCSTSIKPHKLDGNNFSIKISILSKSISCARSKGQIRHTLTLQSTSASSQKGAISPFPKKYTQSTSIQMNKHAF